MNNLIDNLLPHVGRPPLYQPGTAGLWEDDHISQGMLDAHLNPDSDAASRNPGFIRRSARWIAGVAPPGEHSHLLDLGCGPGLYAEAFTRLGYRVTGVDLSPRSIGHARRSAETEGLDIDYRLCNYLRLEEDRPFDLAALIYCDLGALPTDDRSLLLGKVWRMLRPGGRFVFDAFMPPHFAGQPEGQHWEYADGGFWHAGPHLCLHSICNYEEGHTQLRRHVVVSGQDVACYHVWEHAFTREELARDLREAAFGDLTFYGDITGAPYRSDGDTLCAVAVK